MSAILPDALAHSAAASGRGWASRILSGVATAGRAAAGGWPGTLSEARVLAWSIEGAGALPPSQVEALARAVYAAARAEWLVHAERELGD